MDAIIYLKTQHDKFRKTFKMISKTSNEKLKLQKFDNLCKELVAHETMEQKAWYPVLRKNKDLSKVIKHLVSEEKSAAKAIKSFKKLEFGIIWRLKFTKFKYDVEHHADEEETELFPEVRKYLTSKELNTLGTKMKKFKSNLKAKLKKRGSKG